MTENAMRESTSRPAGLTRAQWKRVDAAMQARLSSLLTSHVFPGHTFSDVPAPIQRLSSRNRVRCLALLIVGLTAMGHGRLTYEQFQADMRSAEKWPTSPTQMTLERYKKMLVRRVVVGCRKRGEL